MFAEYLRQPGRMRAIMRAPAIILVVLALFSSAAGLPAVCAALCTMPPADSSAGHSHHETHMTPSQGDVMEANPCMEHPQNVAVVAGAPRRSDASLVPADMGLTLAPVLTTKVNAAPAVLGSPPIPLLSLNPPLRI